MKNRIRVGVITGGDSPEHEVSRASGEVVLDWLDRGKYETLPVFISRGGGWSVSLEDLREQIDIAFLTLRGRGVDGETIQSILKNEDVPYTGGDVLHSALALNKVLAGRLFAAHGFNVPRFESAGRHNWKSMDLRGLDYPLVVKPVDQGSSLGVAVARSNDELGQAIMHALDFSNSVIVQEFIPGHEITCTVLDDGAGDIVPLPVTEILPGHGIFDYEKKHAARVEHHMTPARLTTDGARHIQQAAAQLHSLVGANGVSRTDMIISEDDTLYILEVNTVPHITRGGLLWSAVESHGLTISEFLDRIVEAGLRKHGLLLTEL